MKHLKKFNEELYSTTSVLNSNIQDNIKDIFSDMIYDDNIEINVMFKKNGFFVKNKDIIEINFTQQRSEKAIDPLNHIESFDHLNSFLESEGYVYYSNGTFYKTYQERRKSFDHKMSFLTLNYIKNESTIKNEELDSTTYVSAADKLKDIGHIRRSEEVRKYANVVYNKERDVKELPNLNSFKHDNPFKINIIENRYKGGVKKTSVIMSGNFYLKVNFDREWAQDRYNSIDKHDNYDGDDLYDYLSENYYLPFEVGIMPADDETKNLFRLNEEKFADDLYDGCYWILDILYKLIKEDCYKIEPDGSFFWESRAGDSIQFDNRSEAIRFKKMFIDLVNGKNRFGNCKWLNGTHKSLKKFFLGRWGAKWNASTESYENVHMDDVFDKGAFKRFLDSTNKMSVNQLYSN